MQNKHPLRYAVCLLLPLTLSACVLFPHPPRNSSGIADTATYRQAADIRLVLDFQGTTANMLTRVAHLVGTPGSCHAWYRISEVIQQPDQPGLQPGDRIWLGYPCTRDHSYSYHGDTITWAKTITATGAIRAWLRAKNIQPKSQGLWEMSNPDDRFPPVGFGTKKAAHE